jgi:hypothetical protein
VGHPRFCILQALKNEGRYNRDAGEGGHPPRQAGGNIVKTPVGFVLVVLCCCHQSSAEDKVLKADLEPALVGKPVVSKIVLGCKAKPKGQWATYPVNTLVYPDATRVIFRVEQGAMRATVSDHEIKQQFDQGTAFRITAVDLKDDRLELSLAGGVSDSAKLKLMLGSGWQSKFDVPSVREQIALVLSPGPEPKLPQRTTSSRPQSPSGHEVQRPEQQVETAVQASTSDATSTTEQNSQPELGVYAQDAATLEAQYGTCAKHYIPADKCTPEIYRQLKERDEAPLDPLTASALEAVKYYQTRLKNPASLQLHTAYITDRGDICLEVGAQNTMGGTTVSNVVYTHNGKWLDEGGFGGALAQQGGGGVNRWQDVCTKGIFHPKLVSGTDVTEKVNQALKNGK